MASGGPGTKPQVGGQGAKPPEADKGFVFKTFIFNASAIVLHEMTYGTGIIWIASFVLTFMDSQPVWWLLTYKFNVAHIFPV